MRQTEAAIQALNYLADTEGWATPDEVHKAVNRRLKPLRQVTGVTTENILAEALQEGLIELKERGELESLVRITHAGMAYIWLEGPE